MDERCVELSSRLVGESYVRQASEAMAGLSSKMRLLLEQGKLPEQGWQDREIELVLAQVGCF